MLIDVLPLTAIFNSGFIALLTRWFYDSFFKDFAILICVVPLAVLTVTDFAWMLLYVTYHFTPTTALAIRKTLYCGVCGDCADVIG